MRTSLTFAAIVLALVPGCVTAQPLAEVLRVREWRAANERQIVAQLLQLVSLPNIAANKSHMASNADALGEMFERRGFAIERIETAGAPVLVASRNVTPAAGTLGFYMHYDGQPVEPEDWTRTQPFEPRAFIGDTPLDLLAGSARLDPEARVYGRSTSDDKGPIVAFLAALDGLAAAGAGPNWNLRVVLDGEEEALSPNFDATLQQHADAVRSDLVVLVDSPRHPSERPTVFYGTRGGVNAVVTVFGASGDVHSGNYGNFVTDPVLVLARLLASMKDDAGNVTIKDFYEGVVPLTELEKAAIDAIPNTDHELLEAFGLARAEHPESRLDVQHNRPTLSITGIEAGRVGVGATAAMPRRASARIGVRLVAGLSPRTQLERIVAHVRARGLHLVEDEPDAAIRRQHALIARVTEAGASYVPSRSPMDDRRTAPVVAAVRSLGKPVAQLPTIGGGIPAFATFTQTLGMPTIGLALANFDNNQHAADENIRLGHLWDAVDTFAALLTMPK